MTYIDPETLKIQLYSFVTSSYLPFHGCALAIDIQMSLVLTLHYLRLLFERGCAGHLTSRRGHPTGHNLARRGGRGGRAQRSEANPDEAGLAVS